MNIFVFRKVQKNFCFCIDDDKFRTLYHLPIVVFQDLKPYIIVSFVRCKVTTLERSEHKHSFQVSTFLGEKHVFAAFESREKEDWMNYIINFNMENTVQSFSINRNAIAANLNFKQSNEQRQQHN